jgi:hypothetical protein
MTTLERHIIKSLKMLSEEAKDEAIKTLNVNAKKKRVSQKDKFKNMNLSMNY